MIVFIVNPKSGNGWGTRVWLRLKPLLKRYQIPYNVYFTERPFHAGELVQKALRTEAVKAVFAIGGDGTVNEAAQPLVGKQVPLGVVPAGSGNDFARALDVSDKCEEVVSKIQSFRPRRIDVVQINERFVLNGVGIGFDGAVAAMVNTSKIKPWLNRLNMGRFIYVTSALRLLRTFCPMNITLAVDGKKRAVSDVWLMTICNVPNYGGGMRICPQARYDDGKLDLCLVRDLSQMRFLTSLAKVYRGKHVNVPGVTIMQAENVRIDSNEALPIHVDGETFSPSPWHIQIRKKALHVL